ncbi:MAG: tRNA(fMet)-specific endonuclease VapC [Sphingomonadales bacterium]|jgi:tRNA(fMet)-specific endonuclease VapC|nr:tRNA(fMet)-specific endonuclease VapC [Sphingomonadales bacterium]
MADGSKMAEPRVLLDSNICIYLIEGLSEPVRRRVETFAAGELVTSAVAYAEVMRGIHPENSVALANAESVFDMVPVLAFGLDAALEYRRLPLKRHSFDRLIAAHALSLGVPIATNNEVDFAGVPGLRIENWTLP